MTVLRLVKNTEDSKVKVIEPYKKTSKLMSVREFSEEYGIGRHKAYELANRKDFPKVKNGNQILIIRSLLPKWFEDHIGLEF